MAFTAAEGVTRSKSLLLISFLLDLGLPDADGVDVTTKLRELTEGSHNSAIGTQRRER